MRLALLLVLLVLSSATHALAIAKGSKLYIASRDAALLKEPKAKAAKVATLQPGTEVVWLGASEKDKRFHEVMAGTKKGFVLMSDLTPNQPQQELDASSGKLMSAPAFAASSATKGQPSNPLYWAQGSQAASVASAELIYVEELNRAKATPEALEAKHKELHGP